MSAGLILRCGCEVKYEEGADILCPVHGPQGVARTVRMPKPRITGVATGPLVKTTDVPAWTGRLTGGGEAK